VLVLLVTVANLATQERIAVALITPLNASSVLTDGRLILPAVPNVQNVKQVKQERRRASIVPVECFAPEELAMELRAPIVSLDFTKRTREKEVACHAFRDDSNQLMDQMIALTALLGERLPWLLVPLAVITARSVAINRTTG
jgi:hypothetical protein